MAEIQRYEGDPYLLEDDGYEYRNERMEEAYRPPALVTLVFVLAMLAIYFMGRSMEGIYPALGA